MTIGYIGLGNMGRVLAGRLQLQRPVFVYDRDQAAVDRMESAGSTACASVGDLAGRCQIILTCLPTTDHVRTVLFSEGGLAETAKPGTLIIDQTTGDPIATRAMAAELAKREIELIDAPVAGGLEAANAGTIAILVGATEAQFARALPVLSAISAKIFHAGGLGTGYVAKLANNLVYATQRMINIEAVALAVKNGIEPHKAVDILMAGSARSFFLEHAMQPKILSGQLASGFTLALVHKDVRLATLVGSDSNVPLLLGNLVKEYYQMCINEMGWDAQANTAALVVDRIAGTQMVPVDYSVT